MAAALAAPVASYSAEWAGRQAQAVAEDPWGSASRFLIKGGLGLLATGFLCGTGGYFLSASATKAANNEKQVIGNIGNIFSNIKAPTWSPAPSGTAPVTASIQGIQNFAADAWADLQAGGQDLARTGGVMGTLGEDVANGFIDMAKAALAFVMHFPDILWNGLVWGVGGAVADLLNWVFPWLIILGAAMVLIGAAIALAQRLSNATVKPAWDRSFARWSARREEKVEGFFDRLLHNPPSRPVFEAAPAAEAERTKPEGVGRGEPAPDIGTEGPATPAAQDVVVASAPEPPPPEPQTSPPTPPPNVEVHVDLPAGVPTRTELEDHLGEVPNRAPTIEEMRKLLEESEANRLASMPKKPKGVSGYEESRRAADAFAAAESAEA